jgi:DNA-binding response OmpR family regulator
MHLSEAGYEVSGTIDAGRAVQLLGQGGIGVAIIDVGAHGIAVAREARSRNIPVILISGRPVLFEIGGIGDILQKPFALKELLHRVAAGISQVSQL